jgi:hypothetical protein
LKFLTASARKVASRRPALSHFLRIFHNTSDPSYNHFMRAHTLLTFFSIAFLFFPKTSFAAGRIVAATSTTSTTQDKTAIDLIGPNGKPVKGAQIPSTTGEDFSSMGRKQAALDAYYTPKLCGKALNSKTKSTGHESALIRAVRGQDLPKLARLAKRKKFNANGTDRCGMTAVQNAALQGDTSIMLFLIEHHADLRKKNRKHEDACSLLTQIDDQNLSRFLDLCK